MEIFTTFNQPIYASEHHVDFGNVVVYVGKYRPDLMAKLSAGGYQCIRVENFFQAREHLWFLVKEKNSIPEAIFCDIHLPVSELRSFLHDLNAYESLQSVPLFLLTYKKDALKEFIFLQSRFTRINDFIFFDSNQYVIDHKIRFYQHFNKMRMQHSVVMQRDRDLISWKVWIDYGIKRIFDISVASVLLLILSPLFLLIAIAVKLDSPGPVFYVSLRAGKRFRVFKFYKFRTMIPDADQRLPEIEKLNQYKSQHPHSPKFIKVQNDPRVTRLGRLLRKTSLDELPQLWNVIKGDLSLVGNRPLPLYEAVTLTTDHYSTRFIAPAGITGLWQITKRGKIGMSVEERVNLDITYALERNFILDMGILIRTPLAMVQQENL